MQTLKMDFQSQSTPPVVPVMQSDAQSRFIGLTLYDGGVPYSAPSGAQYTVQYRGSGAKNMGWYDTIQLSSGTRKAVVVSSSSPNVVTLELAEQALRVNGKVEVSLCVVNNTGYKLNTFPIICRVTGAPYVDPVAVRSYFYVTGITSEQWLAYVTACQDAQKRAEDAAAKFVIDDTLTQKGQAADAKAVGEEVGEIKEDIADYYKNWYEIDGELVETRYEGYAWNGLQKTESNYMKCAEVSVKPNELYSFWLQIGNNWTGITFVDANNNIIESYFNGKEWVNYYDYRMRAPKGSKKALINSNKNGSLAVYELTNRKYKYILPGYYRNHLDSKIAEINSAIGKDEAQDYYGVGYIFVTDIHAPANTWTFLPLVERIRALTNAKMLINCGDNVRALGTKDDLISDLREVMDATYSIFGDEMLYALGNHDFIISDSNTWGENTKMIAKALNYQINLSPLGILTRKHYYYHDDDVGMIRHIIIDYLDTDKSWFVEWLRDAIRNTPTNYHIAFYMHWNIFEKDGSISNSKYQYLVDWISAIQKKTTFSENISTTFGNVKIDEDYTDTTHAICYFACGHQHMDYMHVVNGVTYFVSDCCANYNDNGVVNRVSGTTTDTAFDVICANVKRRSVTLIRIGAGKNRSWTY